MEPELDVWIDEGLAIAQLIEPVDEAMAEPVSALSSLALMEPEDEAAKSALGAEPSSCILPELEAAALIDLDALTEA